MEFDPEVFRAILKERGMNQRMLGKIVGVSGTSIGYYLSGRSVPSVNVAARMAEVLRCQVEDFMAQEVR